MKRIQISKALIAVGAALGLGACNSSSTSAVEPEPEINSVPVAAVTFPVKSAYTDAQVITVRGTASDDTEVRSVSVNGVEASTTNGFANWSAEINLEPGTNILEIIATDDEGATSEAVSTQSVTQRHEIRRPYGFEFDESNDLVYFADLFDLSISTINTQTGDIQRITKFEEMVPATVSPRYPADLALDLENNRIFATIRENVVDGPANAIGVRAFSLDTGAWSGFSDIQIDPDAVLTNPVDLILDSANNRLIAVDFDSSAVVGIDLDTGEQSVLSSNTIPDSDLALLDEPTDVAIDYSSNTLLLADRRTDVILGIDLTTGARSLVSGAGTGSGPEFEGVHSMVLDADNNRLVVFDRNAVNRPLIGVSLADGSRTVVSDNEDAEAFTERLLDARSLIMSDTGKVFAMDPLFCHAMEIDLETRARRFVANNGFPRNVPLTFVEQPTVTGSSVYGLSNGSLVQVTIDGSHRELAGLAIDEAEYLSADYLFIDSQEVYALLISTVSSGPDSNTIVKRVSLSDGAIEVLSDNNTPSTDNVLQQPTAAVFDEASSRLIVVAGDTVTFVNSDDGTRTALAADASLPFDDVIEASLDLANNRLLVSDSDNSYLVAVDLDDGERSMFSQSGLPDDLATSGLEYLTSDSNGVTWALEANDRLVSIDGSTGQRALLLDLDQLDGTLGGWRTLEQHGDSLYVRTFNYLLQIDKLSGETVKILAMLPGCPAGGGPTEA